MEMFDLVEVPEEQHGVFFAGDCYVILYAYRSVMVLMMMMMMMMMMLKSMMVVIVLMMMELCTCK